jgi:hypothetical protein
MSWPEVRDVAGEGRVVVQPVGMLEDHGHHLPIITDVTITDTICRRATEKIRESVVLMPTQQNGYSPHHMDFPGSITIRGQTFVDYMLDVNRSLIHHGFRRILLVNGHGSNMPWLETVSRLTMVEAPNVLCGKEDTGTITLRATISHGVKEGVITNPNARERHAEVEIKVQGPPTNMVLSASPSSLVCDGTASSTVSATLTDAEGNPAVDGNTVRFDVKALGVASPIEAKSVAGAATTNVTPLTDIARGVAVKATLLLTEGEEEEGEEPAPGMPTPTPTVKEISVPDIEESILVECAAAPGVPAPGAPAAGGAPAISPPATGDGGYLQGG